MRLDYQHIVDQLDDHVHNRLADIIILDEVSSTNDYLLQHGRCHTVCLAEKQTAGRGRGGKIWSSPEAENIYLSFCYCFPKPLPKQLPLLSLEVAIVVAETLADFGLEQHSIKWPNDLYWQQRKMGGILIERQLQYCVIGIGLNIHMQCNHHINQPWVSLIEASTRQVERHSVIAALLNRLVPRLHHFPQLALQDFQANWKKWDYLAGYTVEIISNQRRERGIALGINPQGQLLVELESGRIQAFSSAEVSVRK